MKVDLAENWWLEEGQFCNPDTDLFPRVVVKQAFNAGFELGFTLGKSQANKPFNSDIKKSCDYSKGGEPPGLCRKCGKFLTEHF